MEQTKEITLKVNLTAKKVYALLVLALMLWRPALLDSAQTMTMTSYYPAPYGGYYQLVSKSTTYLADSSATLYANRNGGYTYIGNYNAQRSTGGSYMHQYGNAYLGRLYNSASTAPTGNSQFGSTHIGYESGQAYVGYAHTAASQANTAIGYQGLFSRVPISTSEHIYVGGSASYYRQYKSAKGVNSSNPYSNPSKILIDLSSYGFASDNVNNPMGLLVVKSGNTAIFNIDSNAGVGEAFVGGGNNTKLRLLSGGKPAITVTTLSLPHNINAQGNLYVNGDIYLGNKYNSSDKTKIYNLCYQQSYGYGQDVVYCDTGYTAIGFLPNNMEGAANAASRVSVEAQAFNTGTYANAPMLYTNDARAMAKGYITCCAIPMITVK